MSISPVEPSRGSLSRAVKLVISSVYLLTPIGLLVYRFWKGQSVDSIILLIVVMLIVASAYTVYGKKTVDNATDTAQELTGEGGDEDDSSK